MRTGLLLSVILLSATAAADTPKAPDLVFRWTEGEMSRDMSVWRTTITVTGTRLHYTRRYSGRDPMPSRAVELDATVKDPKRVTAALDALDKIKVTSAARSGNETITLREGCVTRGKSERCASVESSKTDPADVKAMVAIRDALLDGVKLPSGL